MNGLEFSVQNIVDGQGISIAITGMLIVFFALLVITIYIAMVPKILGVLAPFLPPETEHAAPSSGSASGNKRIEEELLAAVGYAVHCDRIQDDRERMTPGQ